MKIPKGYYKVNSGEVKLNDLLWTPETQQFEPPGLNELGILVTSFKLVIRQD